MTLTNRKIVTALCVASLVVAVSLYFTLFSYERQKLSPAEAEYWRRNADSLEKRYGGKKGIGAIEKPERVEVYLLKHTFARGIEGEVVVGEKEMEDIENLDMARTNPIRLPPKAIHQLQADLLDTKNYMWGGLLACGFQPDIEIIFYRSETTVAITICLGCDEMDAFFNNKPTIAPGMEPGFEDHSFTQIQKRLRTTILEVAKEAFPNDLYLKNVPTSE